MAQTIIGSFEFGSKKEATTRIREILHGSNLGEPLVGNDLELISVLVGCHPDAAEKIGSGIRSIDVRIVEEHAARGFWITRTDGTIMDFSYRICLNNSLAGHQARVLDALRRGINDQIVRYRREYFATTLNPTCSLTGQPLHNDRTSHVDHWDPPFSELAETFIKALANGDAKLIPTRPSPTGIGHVLADPIHLELWQGLHRERATLRVIHRSANLNRNHKAEMPTPIIPSQRMQTLFTDETV